MKSIGRYLHEKTVLRLILYLAFQTILIASFVRYAGLRITPGLVIFVLPFILSPMTRSLSGKELQISLFCFSVMALISWVLAFTSGLRSGLDVSPNAFLFPGAFAAVFTVIAGEAFLRLRRTTPPVER
jgi:hypothetical protein